MGILDVFHLRGDESALSRGSRRGRSFLSEELIPSVLNDVGDVSVGSLVGTSIVGSLDLLEDGFNLHGW